MRVLKFGGTSVLDAKRIRNVARIVQQQVREEPAVVVVSALGGLTDVLVELAGGCADGASQWPPLERSLDEIRQRNLQAAEGVAAADESESLRQTVEQHCDDLRQVVRGAHLLRECSMRARDRLLAFGERASAPIVAAALRALGTPAEAVDASRLIVTDSNHGNARVQQPATDQQCRRVLQALLDRGTVPVVTGFIAADAQGVTTTLGRGGSDYTAALLGAALDASAIEIWTDVDGVLSADPRRVPDARWRPELSFEEVMELAHFGAKVVYPPTILPARKAGIPIAIRNSLRPEHPGTRISDGIRGTTLERPVVGVSSTGPVALFRLQGAGMVGVPGVAGRLFRTLAGCEISIILITQASSEHSISFATAPGCTDAVFACVHREFENERRSGLIEDLQLDEDVCVIAAVGDGMAERPGIAVRLFDALARAAVNVHAIAQSSSERNISLVVHTADEERALRQIHSAFFSAAAVRVDNADRPLDFVLCGVGGVGGALWRQTQELPLRCVALVGSRHWLRRDEDGDWPEPEVDDLRAWLHEHGSERLDFDRLRDFLEARPGAVLVDCTADPELAEHHADLLALGIPVVTANKYGVAGSREVFGRLEAHLGFDAQTRLEFEATIGAGLPIVQTALDLRACGDELLAIEGVFSGTLAFVIDQLRGGASFSEAVRHAYDLGYTEPDPRQDLDGMDVARKLLLAARLAGQDLDMDDLTIDPLWADPAGDVAMDDELWQRIEASNADVADRFATLEPGRQLVYLAQWTPEGARVGLTEVDASHPAAQLSGTDNLFRIVTRRTPGGLVIRGPGAGVEVTASAVATGLLRLQRRRAGS